MTIRILCTGDIHLGRRPTQIPEDTSEHSFRPTQAWHAFVQAAIERKVAAVVLTGDIVDESNKFYEAFSALKSGVERLVNAGICILAIAGNHDFDVLPRLADQIPEFRLLGRGGQWEEFILKQDGISAVRFYGWSFPTRHISNNPLEEYAPPSDDLPTICLLHCDCDVPTSIYGPVSLTELKAKAPTGWILGHIHKPGILSETFPLILYPGSLQGLDPGEPGTHGGWLITLEQGHILRTEILPLAGLRWERIEISLESVSDEESLQRMVIDALRKKHEQIRDELGQTRIIGCRLYLRGRTQLHRRLSSLISPIQSELKYQFEDAGYFIEKIENLSRPDISLEDIGRSNDPAGLLARLLLILEHREPSEAYKRLIDKAKRPIEDSRSRAQFTPLASSAEPLDQEHIRDLLMKTGLRALDGLLAQKEIGK